VDEYPQFVPAPLARRVAARSHLLDSFLRRVLEDTPDAMRFQLREAPLLVHVHCHQRALAGAETLTSLMRDTLGEAVCELDAGCCGMAGAFGHEQEHHDVAKAMGEHRLFPRVRGRQGGDIAVTGFSCRHQITHHTDARPRHAIEYLAEACRPAGADQVSEVVADEL
jgi:Fe-S oxidoreductase